MEEPRLDFELGRIHREFLYLWKYHNYHIEFFTKDYGIYYRGFIVGLENDICKFIFEKETQSPVEPITVYVGTKSALYSPPDYSYWIKYGWYPLAGLIQWLSGVECQRDKDVDNDLKNVSQYLRIYLDKVIELFRFPNEFDKRLDYYRNLYKDKQITVEKIRAERARLHALGQDSSLEAAIASLRGGKK